MNENSITTITLSEVDSRKGQTDWARLAKSDGTESGDGDFDWSSAEIVEPVPKKSISLRVDPEVLAFFKSGGKGYQTRMNAVLRAYAKAHGI